MLLGSLYRIVSSHKDENSVSARLELHPEHTIFNGHFPEMPIVPGVCLLQMMAEILSSILEEHIQVKQINQIKFLSFVNPRIQKQLDLKLKIEKKVGNTFLVEGSYIWEQTIFLKFKGEFDEHGST